MGFPSSIRGRRRLPDVLALSTHGSLSDGQIAPSLALNEVELATRWSIAIKTLQRWRSDGRGPLFCKLGTRVTYLIKDVEAYELQVARYSTSARVAVYEGQS